MDTLYVDIQHSGEYDVVMRTHTSPNQVRVMEKTKPPIRVVVPGRCYRNEATDVTHEWMQTQIELLAVDEGISLTDLKGTLFEFAKRIFGQERQSASAATIPIRRARRGDGDRLHDLRRHRLPDV